MSTKGRAQSIKGCLGGWNSPLSNKVELNGPFPYCSLWEKYLPTAYRAIYEESPEDDDSKQDRAGGLDDLEVTVLVGEEDHHRKAADDDALEDEEDGPEDHVEGDDASRAVNTFLTSLRTLQTLELSLQVIQGQVLALKQWKYYILWNIGNIILC